MHPQKYELPGTKSTSASILVQWSTGARASPVAATGSIASRQAQGHAALDGTRTHLTVRDRNPRLSIGLAVFNGEKFIRQAVESLLHQSFEDFQLIISDNASADHTEEICRGFAAQDSRVRY